MRGVRFWCNQIKIGDVVASSRSRDCFFAQRLKGLAFLVSEPYFNRRASGREREREAPF